MDDLRQTKFGHAHHVRFFVCSDGHIHVIGFGPDDDAEYEIVLGKTLMERCQSAIDSAQIKRFSEMTEIF